MKIVLTILALAFALHAEDAAPTVEQLQTKVAEQAKQIAEQAAELRLYQQGLFQCQAAEIHAQAVAQADAQAKRKPEEKAK
jgi:hypothetical protein